MRELIYYPGFEVKSKDWLKFALLYMNTLSPIIPHSGDRHLTNLYWQLADETDLLDFHRPEYEEGHRASLDSLGVVEKFYGIPSGITPYS